MDTPARPLIFSKPPPVLRPKFKRPHICSFEDEDFVPSKLYFPSPVFDDETRGPMGCSGGASEVSQIWHGLLEDIPNAQNSIPDDVLTGIDLSQLCQGLAEDIPDSQPLIPGENPVTQHMACNSEAPIAHAPPTTDDSQIWDIPDELMMEVPDFQDPIPPANTPTLEPLPAAASAVPNEWNVSIRNLLDMKVDENDCIPARRARSAMRSIVRAAIYGILNHCIREFLFEACEGCLIQAGGQKSHDCLSWSEETIERKVKYVCDMISMTPVLVLMTSIAYSLKCLSLTQENMDEAIILLDKVTEAPQSRKALETILKANDKKFLKYVEGYISDKHYKSFFIGPRTGKIKRVSVL